MFFLKSAWLKYVIGLSYNKIAPTPSPEATHSTLKIFEKSGSDSIEA